MNNSRLRYEKPTLTKVDEENVRELLIRQRQKGDKEADELLNVCRTEGTKNSAKNPEESSC
jgi:hypothetical protein